MYKEWLVKAKADAVTKYKATEEAYDEWEEKNKAMEEYDETDRVVFEEKVREVYEAEVKWKKCREKMLYIPITEPTLSDIANM